MRHAPGFSGMLSAAALSVAVLSMQGAVRAGAPQEPAGVPMDTGLFRNIARQQNPVVVAIMTTALVDAPLSDEEDALRRFFGLPPQPGSRVEQGLGSGFLIGPDGEILTNDHVVAGAQTIEVGLLGEETITHRATIVGRDPVSDSAIIKLQRPPANLPIARLGDSDALEPGDWVMAIGNPFQLGHTVTVGVISYQGRPFELQEGHWQKLIQTDASINPGNSGGPLINVRGEVVGINAAMLGDDAGGNMGIGFAIPINSIKSLLPQLRAGRVIRGWIGLQVRSGPTTDDDAAALGLPRAAGAIVTAVDRDSPAARGGLRSGDVIISFDGTAVANADDLLPRIASTRPGSRVPVVVIHDGVEQTLHMVVKELSVDPDGAPARAAAPRPSLGLTLGEVTDPLAHGLDFPPDLDGAFVSDIALDSPADRAGVQEGDVVRRVNRQIVHTATDATKEFQRIQAGRAAFLLIWRDGDELLVQVQEGRSATNGR